MSSLKRMITCIVLLDFCQNAVGSVKGSPTPHSLLVFWENAKERETEERRKHPSNIVDDKGA
jgi:hypothetical protein